jgi:hypothetical protein
MIYINKKVASLEAGKSLIIGLFRTQPQIPQSYRQRPRWRRIPTLKHSHL